MRPWDSCGSLCARRPAAPIRLVGRWRQHWALIGPVCTSGSVECGVPGGVDQATLHQRQRLLGRAGCSQRDPSAGTCGSFHVCRQAGNIQPAPTGSQATFIWHRQAPAAAASFSGRRPAVSQASNAARPGQQLRPASIRRASTGQAGQHSSGPRITVWHPSRTSSTHPGGPAPARRASTGQAGKHRPGGQAPARPPSTVRHPSSSQ